MLKKFLKNRPVGEIYYLTSSEYNATKIESLPIMLSLRYVFSFFVSISNYHTIMNATTHKQ